MQKLKKELWKLSNKKKAKILNGFFKTGKGDFGERDIFIGVGVPDIRKIIREGVDRISLEEIGKMMLSKIHEERLMALLLLVGKYRKAKEGERKIIYDFYLDNAKRVNSWDLVDLSAPKIVGDYLLKRKDKMVLYNFARKGNLWERRIAIVSTFAFIRKGEFKDSLNISKILLGDSHNLIHKAIGWMLREIGKRDRKLLERFLKENYSKLPRITLRYAIERLDKKERVMWLKGQLLVTPSRR